MKIFLLFVILFVALAGAVPVNSGVKCNYKTSCAGVCQGKGYKDGYCYKLSRTCYCV
uniref:Protease inhibitor 9 n=1 Tax=Lonomia obliqua TaxID=304329 RepID=Q5MGE9_LONON|nr:protease inhibitor 9 [Lonomia obliqua]